jgi:hypothetical protein
VVVSVDENTCTFLCSKDKENEKLCWKECVKVIG